MLSRPMAREHPDGYQVASISSISRLCDMLTAALTSQPQPSQLAPPTQMQPKKKYRYS